MIEDHAMVIEGVDALGKDAPLGIDLSYCKNLYHVILFLYLSIFYHFLTFAVLISYFVHDFVPLCVVLLMICLRPVGPRITGVLLKSNRETLRYDNVFPESCLARKPYAL